MSRAAAIEQHAARWIMLREEAGWTAIDQAGLEAWLEESLAHKAAFWRLEHGWREADRIAALGKKSGPASIPAFLTWPRRRAFWIPAAAAAALVVALVGSGIQMYRPHNPLPAPIQRYATAIGDRKLVPLVDGSKVELNTASIVRTAVTKERRDVWLDRGEAYFEIAHLNGKPFVVHAGSRTVTVLGTKFSVRRDGDKVTVSVVEGRVRVEDAVEPDAVPAAIITAGDVAVARGPSTLLAAKSEERVMSELAWRGGMLNFDRTSLSDAVNEFNRYNVKKIVVGDAETGMIRIGGTFQASNVDAFVRLLHDAYGIHVEPHADGVKISS